MRERALRAAELRMSQGQAGGTGATGSSSSSSSGSLAVSTSASASALASAAPSTALEAEAAAAVVAKEDEGEAPLSLKDIAEDPALVQALQRLYDVKSVAELADLDPSTAPLSHARAAGTDTDGAAEAEAKARLGDLVMEARGQEMETIMKGVIFGQRGELRASSLVAAFRAIKVRSRGTG